MYCYKNDNKNIPIAIIFYQIIRINSKTNYVLPAKKRREEKRRGKVLKDHVQMGDQIMCNSILWFEYLFTDM